MRCEYVLKKLRKRQRIVSAFNTTFIPFAPPPGILARFLPSFWHSPLKIAFPCSSPILPPPKNKQFIFNKTDVRVVWYVRSGQIHKWYNIRIKEKEILRQIHSVFAHLSTHGAFLIYFIAHQQLDHLFAAAHAELLHLLQPHAQTVEGILSRHVVHCKRRNHYAERVKQYGISTGHTERDTKARYQYRR